MTSSRSKALSASEPKPGDLAPLRALWREQHPRPRRIPDDDALVRWCVRELRTAARIQRAERELRQIRRTWRKYAGRASAPVRATVRINSHRAVNIPAR